MTNNHTLTVSPMPAWVHWPCALPGFVGSFGLVLVVLLGWLGFAIWQPRF